MTRALALLLLLISSVAMADGDAERLYREGQAAYDAKKYDDAIAAWSQSYELSHLPALVFNLAQAYRLKGDCDDAVTSYKKFIDLDPKSRQRPAAEGFIKDLEPCPVAEPPKQEPPKPPPPTQEPPRPPPPKQQLPPKPPVATATHHSTGERVTGIGLAVAGAVAVGVGAYFGNQASSDASDVRAACASGCDYDSIKQKDQDGRSDAKLQYVMYGVGAGAVAIGAVLFVIGSREHADPPPVAIVPTRGGGAVSWTIRF